MRRRDLVALRALWNVWGDALAGELLSAWPELTPLEKAATARSLTHAPLLDLFGRLPPAERLLVLAAQEPGALAPLLEGADEATRSLLAPAAEATRDALLKRGLE